jgi:hypothetical protein
MDEAVTDGTNGTAELVGCRIVIHADSGGRSLAVMKGCALVLSARDTVRSFHIMCMFPGCYGRISQ